MGLFSGFKRDKKSKIVDKPEEALTESEPVSQEPEGSQVGSANDESIKQVEIESKNIEPEEKNSQPEEKLDEPEEKNGQPEEKKFDKAAENDVLKHKNEKLDNSLIESRKNQKKEEPQPEQRDTEIIAIINQKGGVGKSTTAINLSAALCKRGKDVLLIDLDPQGNSTSGLGIDKTKVEKCVYDTLLDNEPIADITIHEVLPGLDVAPATIDLAGAEVELVPEMARENRLKDAVVKLPATYDYVFIDCPPSLGLLTVNALVAADKLLIPIQCEFYALEGVTKLLDSMKRVKSRLNPSLEIFGVLLTMYDGRTTLSKDVADEVHNYFGDKVFEAIIPRTVKLSEAPSFGQPICEYDPSGKGAQAYNDLAKEVMLRG